MCDVVEVYSTNGGGDRDGGDRGDGGGGGGFSNGCESLVVLVKW